MPSSRGSSQPKDGTRVSCSSCIAGTLQSWDRRVRLRLFLGMELRLPLELFLGFQAPCQTVCGICRFFHKKYGPFDPYINAKVCTLLPGFLCIISPSCTFCSVLSSFHSCPLRLFFIILTFVCFCPSASSGLPGNGKTQLQGILVLF